MSERITDERLAELEAWICRDSSFDRTAKQDDFLKAIRELRAVLRAIYSNGRGPQSWGYDPDGTCLRGTLAGSITTAERELGGGA